MEHNHGTVSCQVYIKHKIDLKTYPMLHTDILVLNATRLLKSSFNKISQYILSFWSERVRAPTAAWLSVDWQTGFHDANANGGSSLWHSNTVFHHRISAENWTFSNSFYIYLKIFYGDLK